MKDLFKEILERTPTEPGVYLMRNKTDKIVYVGKARNLRSRLRTYFTGADPRPFAKRLNRILGNVETMITRNEKEALLLENRLIKAHQPRYNVKLRDDKNFLSLKVDVRKDWPRVEVVRRQKRDGAHYFGPYHSASSIRQMLRVLNRYFGLRTCPDNVLNNRSRPCLQYQIKRCPAPCVLDIDKQEYDRSVDEAVLFLQGKKVELVNSLERRMKKAAEEWAYELAAHYRDQINDVKRSLMQQSIESVKNVDQDAIGLYREGDSVAVELLFVRKGIIIGNRRFQFANQEIPNDELLTSFIMQYYTDGAFIPHEILVPELPESHSVLGELLSELRARKVRVSKPVRGDRRALMETARVNAEQAFRENKQAEHQRLDVLKKLQTRLHLRAFPKRIECFDISNLGDTAIVGSMVVMIDGEMTKSAYRTFRVKTVPEQDDFASMQEVLSRRVRRSQEGNEPWPDLMVIDGGKGQLGSVLKALENLGAHELEVVGLAKARAKSGAKSDDVVRSDERVFLPGIKDPIMLRPNTAERHLMERIRDEAHRFALNYHRKLRRKKGLGSILERIPGVGSSRRKQLLAHFGTIARIKASSVDELREVKGISPALARRIWSALSE